MDKHRHIDQTKLMRGLVTFLLVISTISIASYGIRASKAIVYWMVVAFPVIVYFVKDPRSIFIFGVMSALAWLKTPGMQSRVLWPFNLAAAALFASSLALVAMKKLSPPKRMPADNWLLGFIVVVFFTMGIRGGGLSMLGSKNWGGGRYISMLLLFCFYFSMRKFQYNRGHVRWLIWGSLFATGMLALSQILFSYTGGQSYGLTNFMEIQAEYAADSALLGIEKVTRFTHLRWMAYALLPLAFFWPQRKILSSSVVLASVFMMFMTGFRSEVVSLGVVYIACGLVFAERKFGFLVFLVVAGVTGYIALLALSGILPDAVTRSVSFLPGIKASAMIEQGTQTSLEWRLEVWKHCVKAVPENLLVGRGITFGVMEWAWLNKSIYNSPEFFYATHAYHNGPLSLLLDFGIFGFITMTAFFLSSAKYAIQGLNDVRGQGTIYYKFAVYLIVLYIWMIIKFYLIYGDLTYYLGRMIVIYTILMATLSYLKHAPPYALSSHRVLSNG